MTSGNLTKYSLLAGICLLVFGLGYWLVKEAAKPQPGEFVKSLGNGHLQNISDPHDPYNSLPPTSGTHLTDIAPWGISDTPIPDELQVHNLEDGGVMVQYNCAPGADSQPTGTPSAQSVDECKQLVDNLKDVVNQYQEEVILAPYPKLDTRIALTAWNRIDKFNDFDKTRIEKFIRAYKGIDHHEK